MKYKVYSLNFIYFFIVMHLCYAMEKKGGWQNIPMLTCVKKPNKILYFGNAPDKVVVRHQDGCSIIDIEKDKEIKKITKSYCDCLAVDCDREEIIFSRNKSIKVYNTQTNKYVLSKTIKRPIRSFCYRPHDNIIFLFVTSRDGSYGVLKRYDFVKKNFSNDYIICMQQTPFIFHPKKQIMCHVYHHEISVYNPFNFNTILKTIRLPIVARCFQISACGFLAAISVPSAEIALVDLNKNNLLLRKNGKPFLLKREKEKFFKMSFYSKGEVLATISRSTKENVNEDLLIMRYWDIKAQKLIDPVFSLDCGTVCDFIFSPNGKKIIFAFSAGCAVYPVPFEVEYEPGIEKRFPYLLFLLKNYVEQQKQGKQEDIMKLLAYVCFETFKR